MPRTVDTGFQTEITRVDGTEPILWAVELNVPFYAGNPTKTLRMVDDTDDLVIDGEVFVGVGYQGFSIAPPDDKPGELPIATLQFGLVPELVKLIESTHGAAGATARIMMLARSIPTPQLDFTMTFYGITISPTGITGQLGYRDLMSRSSLNMRYEHRTAAGLY